MNKTWYYLGPKLGWRHRLKMRIYRLLVRLHLRKRYISNIRVYDE